MLSLFYSITNVNSGKIINNKVNYLTNNINSIFYILDAYYKTSNRYVRRPNMLVSLIESLGIDYTKQPEDVFSELDATSIYAASDHKIVNGIKFAHEFNNDTVLYNTDELFIATSSQFDYLKETYDGDSIKCIYSNTSDIILCHPKVYTNSVLGSDIYMYTINIPMVGMQYYYWCKSMLMEDRDVDPARFVYEVLLTNLTKSLFINNLINRFMAIKNGEYVAPMVNYNPFIVKSLNKHIDDVYRYYIKKLDKHDNMDYAFILDTLPTLTGSTFMEYLKLDEIYLNKRTKWVYILSRINIVTFLISTYRSKRETEYHSAIETDFYRMKRNKYLDIPNAKINDLLVKDTDNLIVNLYL